jgi:hypothetical protein
MLQMDLAPVLLDPGLSGMACLANVNLTTIIGHVLMPGVFSFKLSFKG